MLSGLITLVLLFSTPISVFAQVAYPVRDIGVVIETERRMNQRIEAIDDLFRLLLEYQQLENWSEVEAIKLQLEALGVVQLSPQEIQAFVAEIESNDMAPFVTPPQTANNMFFSAQFGTANHIIQRITALPTSNGSGLRTVASATTRTTNNHGLAWTTAVRIGVGAAVGSINWKAAVGVTIFEAVSGFISGINPTQTVRMHDNTVFHSWAIDLTATFYFVRRAGQPAEVGRLSLAGHTGARGSVHHSAMITWTGDGPHFNPTHYNVTLPVDIAHRYSASARQSLAIQNFERIEVSLPWQSRMILPSISYPFFLDIGDIVIEGFDRVAGRVRPRTFTCFLGF